jgi:hypothetical protein
MALIITDTRGRPGGALRRQAARARRLHAAGVVRDDRGR